MDPGQVQRFGLPHLARRFQSQTQEVQPEDNNSYRADDHKEQYQPQASHQGP